MVETDATGRPFPGFGNIKEDIIAAVDETYNLGSESKKWLALWVALAFVTSITIGGVINLSNVDGWLFINASTQINGSLFINGDGNFTGNVSANYYFGDGSQLTNLPTGGNLSWNETRANTLYAAIKWAYNETIGSLVYLATASTNLQTNISDVNSSLDAKINAKVSFPGYTNIAMRNDTNTFAKNQTLSDELILSQDKSIYFGSGKAYYNGTCFIIEGASATMEIC